MIRFEEALRIIEKAARPWPLERVELLNAAGRILAEDVYSDMDMPPFNKSAVDGYACRMEDLDGELIVLEVIAAGKEPQFSIGKGECSKLMTGGMVPHGADTVIMIEDVEETGQNRIRSTRSGTSRNICHRAEDLKRGALVLTKGTLLRPQEIAVLASVGAANPLVFSVPRVGVITTGDELVEPQEVPGISKIRNSNAWQLMAQAQRAGFIPKYYGIAPDNERDTLRILEQASESNDIVLMTGGVSVGDFDFVPAVIEKAGFSIQFRSLAVQPGKPSIFALRGNTYLFALPGNPVSSFVQFELLVRHLVNVGTGNFDPEKTIRLPSAFDYSRRRTDRKSFIPVVLKTDGTLGQLEYHGSAHIHSFTCADGLISLEIGETEIKKGSLLDVRLL